MVQLNMSEVTAKAIAYPRYLNLANRYLSLANKGAWDAIFELEKTNSLHEDRPVAVTPDEDVSQEERTILTNLLQKIITVMTEYESKRYAHRMHLKNLIKAAEDRERGGKSFGKVIRSGTYGAKDLFGKKKP